MPRYYVSDESGVEERIRATNKVIAAERYVHTGAYDPEDKTYWITIHSQERKRDLLERVYVPIHPTPPDCSDTEHEWSMPDFVGVPRSIGGGIWYEEVCVHCGTYRITDTAATIPQCGERGTSIEYRDADDASLAWIADAK